MRSRWHFARLVFQGPGYRQCTPGYPLCLHSLKGLRSPKQDRAFNCAALRNSHEAGRYPKGPSAQVGGVYTQIHDYHSQYINPACFPSGCLGPLGLVQVLGAVGEAGTPLQVPAAWGLTWTR